MYLNCLRSWALKRDPEQTELTFVSKTKPLIENKQLQTESKGAEKRPGAKKREDPDKSGKGKEAADLTHDLSYSEHFPSHRCSCYRAGMLRLSWPTLPLSVHKRALPPPTLVKKKPHSCYKDKRPERHNNVSADIKHLPERHANQIVI